MSGDIAQLSIKVDSTDVPRASSQMDKMADSGAKLENGIKSLVGVWATWEIGKYLSDTALLSARYDTLGVAMHRVGQNIGYTSQEMDQLATKLQATGISMIESRLNLTRLAAAHIDLANATQLARAAQDVAIIGNVNSSQAFETLVHGIQSGRTEILHTMGIQVQFEQGYIRLAAAMGKTTNDLSDQEKAQSRANQVLEYAATLQGTYEAAMGTAGKQMKSMERYAEDLQVKLGEVFQPALAVGVEALSDGLKGMATAMDTAKSNGSLKEWQDSFKSLVIDLRDGTQWLVENKNAVLFLGEAYLSVKIGSAIGSWITSTQALIAAKAQAAIAVNLDRTLAVAEAEAKYAAALATQKEAMADLELVTALTRENAITMSVVGGKNVYAAATERANIALNAQVLAERELMAAQEAGSAINVARGASSAMGAVGMGAAEGAAAGSIVPGVGTMVGAAVGIGIMLLPQLIDLMSGLTTESDKASDAAKKLNGEFDKIKKPQGLESINESIRSLNKELERYERLQAGNGLSDTRFSIAPKAVQDEVIAYKRAIDQLNAGYDHMGETVQYIQGMLNKKPNDKGLLAQLNQGTQAMQAMAVLIGADQAYVEKMAAKEKEREDKQKIVDGHNAEDQKAKDRAEAAKKIVESITSENETLDRERVLLEQGATAAYAFDLTKQGINGSARQSLILKHDENEYSKAHIKFLEDEARATEKYRDEVYKLAEAGPQKTNAEKYADAYRKQISDEVARLNVKDDYTTKYAHNEALRAAGLNLETYQKRQHELFLQSQTVWGAMAYSVENFADSGSSALANFFNGTKTGFREMTASLLVDMEKLILKEQVVAPFLKGLTGFNWGSLFGSGSTPLFEGGTAVSTDLGLGMPAANGGYRDGSRPYLVGENGPEIFNPGQSGSITPNHAIGGTTITSQIIVNVAQDGTASTKGTSSDGNAMARAIQQSVEPLVIQTIQKLQRPGAMLNPMGSRS